MNKKIALITAALVITIAAVAYLGKKKSESLPANAPGTESSQSNPSASTPAAPGASTANSSTTATAPSGNNSPPLKNIPFGAPSAASTGENSSLSEQPLSAEEQKAAQTLMTSLVTFIQPAHSSPNEMLRGLTKLGLQPVMAKDFNPYTGKMLIIRTDKTLPGTRCYHGQYFEDEHKKNVVQHVSFELRPSKDGFAEAEKMLVAQLKRYEEKTGKLGEPVKRTENFVKWDLANNYSAWILRYTADDIQSGDPFCAHDIATDIGTLRVAIEEVPDHDD
jgi:hypothetical protein